MFINIKGATSNLKLIFRNKSEEIYLKNYQLFWSFYIKRVEIYSNESTVLLKI